MAIVTEVHATYEGDLVTLYRIIDNRNTTNATRWRLVAMRIVNGDLNHSYRIYVTVPGGSVDQGFAVVAGPGETVEQDVPPQFQNDDPWAYDWGCGQL